METIRKCSSVKFISIWILPYFHMEYQISGVLGEIPLTRGTLLYKVRILPRSPQRKTEMFTKGIAECKNNKAGDENERRTTVDY